MKDDFTVTEINKTDLVTGDEVAGAKLELYRLKDVTTTIDGEDEFDDNGNLIPGTSEEVTSQERQLIVTWTTGKKDSIKVEEDASFVKGEITSNGKILLEYLPVGQYVLVEKTPADGYTTANEVVIEVVDKLYHFDTDNETILRDSSKDVIANTAQIIKAEMKDDFTVVKFNKIDAVNNENIENAKLEVYAVEVDKDGNVVLADKLDEDGNVLKDENGKAIKQAVRIDADKKAEGVNPMYSWTTGEDGFDKDGNALAHIIERMPIGKYVLVETSAPDGYLVADEVVFEVTDKFYHYKDAQGKEVNEVDGKIVANEDEIIDVTMKDERALLISKQNIVTGQEITGAQLRIYEYVEPEFVEVEIEDEEETTETTDVEDVAETESDVENEDGQEPTPAAEQPRTKLVEVPHDYSNDEIVEEWTSGKKPHGIKVENLVVGKEYVLHEEVAPDGYFLATDIRFRLVEVPGVRVPELQVYDLAAGDFVTVETHTIVMKDDVTRVFVRKVDQFGNYVSGAQLGIYPVVSGLFGEKVDWSNPTVVFTTNGNYADIQALPLGKYVLHEISTPSSVPSGYASWTLAEDIEFEITEEVRSETALDITMVDALVASDNSKEYPVVNPTPTPTPTPEPEVIVIEPVKTGDSNNIIPFVFGGIFLAIAAGGILVLYKRKKEDENSEDAGENE